MKNTSNHEGEHEPRGPSCRFDIWEIAPRTTHSGRFPIPNWSVLDAWITCHVAEENHNDAWFHAATQWIQALRSSLGHGYTIVCSKPVIMLGARSTDELNGLLRFTSKAIDIIGDYLRPVRRPALADVLPIFLPNSLDLYYDYISEFFEDGNHAASAGVYVDEGLPHIVLGPGSRWALEMIIAHELTHASLHKLELPLWIEEGVAQILQQRITHLDSFRMDHELAARHRSYWRAHGLDAFWFGHSFDQSGDAQELSYGLAEVLIRNISSDAGDRFYEFLRSSHRADAGEQSAQEHLGKSLARFAEDFLGEGDWLPRPKKL